MVGMVRMREKLQAPQALDEIGRREPEALSHAPCPETGKLKALFAEPPTRYGVDLDGTPAEIAAQRQLVTQVGRIHPSRGAR